MSPYHSMHASTITVVTTFRIAYYICGAAAEIDVGMERNILLFAPLNHSKCSGACATPVSNVRWQPNRHFNGCRDRMISCVATPSRFVWTHEHICCCFRITRFKSFQWFRWNKEITETESEWNIASMCAQIILRIFFSLFIAKMNAIIFLIFCIHIWFEPNQMKIKLFHAKIIKEIRDRWPSQFFFHIIYVFTEIESLTIVGLLLRRGSVSFLLQQRMRLVSCVLLRFRKR